MPASSLFPQQPVDESFGHWLSGFTDGEGSFILTMQRDKGKEYPRAIFRIGLRMDDRPILDSVQSFLGCGRVYIDPNSNLKRASPQAQFIVYRRKDHLDFVVPHFERFPLRAKKASDFVLYKRGVEIIHRIASTPQKSVGYRNGPVIKWTDAERQEYCEIMRELKDSRRYGATNQSSTLGFGGKGLSTSL